jgi:competence protein ComEC
MGKKLSWARILLLLNSLFIIGVFIVGSSPEAFPPSAADQNLAGYDGQSVDISGRVCEEAETDYKSRKLTVCAPGRILVTTNLYPIYGYGDFLSLSGRIKTPGPINGFAYDKYLARYDIYSLMYYPRISLASGELGWSAQAFKRLLRFKEWMGDLINSNLPEPEAGLANALLLGYRKTVDREDLAIFARVGLSHMIAISGSHITIMSAMIINFFLALGLPRRRALKIVLGFLIVYPLMTGLSASAVRSAIMGGLSFWAMYHGRPSSLIYSLVFSGAAMLAFNPRLLRDDIGFQLSFLALLGIIYIYPLGETVTRKFLDRLAAGKRPLGKKSGRFLKTIFDTINLTLVSQIVILPIALVNFKQLSVIAPLANVLVLWTFPLLLASLIIGLSLSAFVPILGVLWFLPAYLLLKYIFVVSGLLAEPSWAAVAVENFNWWQGGLYYLILWAVVFLLRRVIKVRETKKTGAYPRLSSF